MKSTRFNPPIDWKPTVMNDQKTRINRYFFGLIDLMGAVANHFSSPFRENTKTTL